MKLERYRVELSGVLVGHLDRRGDHVRFALDQHYLERPERPVLGLRIEQSTPRQLSSAMRLPWWFSNLLPEGPLRRWIARGRQVPESREMELLAEVGHDLPGAVMVTLNGSGPPGEWPDADVRASGRDPSGPHTAWKFSLAGVAMKLSMLRQGDRLTLPAGGAGGDWIVKMPDPEFTGVPRNEYTMMRLAAEVGIETPEVLLVHRDELPYLPDAMWPGHEDLAYAVKRFDRTAQGRVHIEDLAQVRGFYPDDKYAGSFESVAANIYRGRDERSLDQFVGRLVLIMLVGNGDAHLKNWSLIYADPRVPALSPVYDIVSTVMYASDQGRVEDLGLSFDGTRSFERATLAGFSRLGQRLGVSADLAQTAASYALRICDSWPRFEAELGDDDTRLTRYVTAHMNAMRRRFGL